MARILTFVLFLVLYGLYFVVATIYVQRLQEAVIRGKWFWSSQVGILLSYVTFFLSVYLLSGFYSPALVILFLVAAECGVLVNAIIRGLLSSAEDKSGQRAIWGGAEFGRNHGFLMVLALAIMLVTLAAYPIVVGIAHFRRTISPGDLTLIIFKDSLVAFVFVGYSLLGPVVFGVLSSENVDQRTRTLYLGSQLSGLITTVLYLALAFWAFGFGQSKVGISVGGIPLTISPKLFLLLFIFFFFTILLPYTIGTVQAKNQNLSLSEKKRDFLKRLRDILNEPVGQIYYSHLEEFQGDLNKAISEFQEKDKTIKWLAAYEGDAIPIEKVDKSEKAIIRSFRDSRDLDPRFRYLDDLRKYVSGVREIIEDLKEKPTDPEKKDASRVWAAKYTILEAELEKEIESAGQAKTGVTVVGGFVLTTLATGILGELAKWAGTTIVSKSLLK